MNPLSTLSSSVRKVILNIIRKLVDKKNGALVFYNDKDRAAVVDLIRLVRSENKMLLQTNEAYQLYMLVKNTLKLKAGIAEVGCFMGGSSKIICEAKGEKEFDVFDTFEGLPELNAIDDAGQFQKGQYSASFDFVKSYLSKYPNVRLHKGYFPDTAGPIENKTFSFVHLDLDLYESTLASLHFFYPRMVKGAVLISHDYTTAPGVQRAFEEFLNDKPEPIIEMSGTQCLIVKC
ncbi:MAG: TylF/MycF/NovP-related O-methyltransferase [Sediminibacterium sp.]|nr:TylF/MycF/NovP-related O-methyltransferase [Sediminibacterium sp.]